MVLVQKYFLSYVTHNLREQRCTNCNVITLGVEHTQVRSVFHSIFRELAVFQIVRENRGVKSIKGGNRKFCANLATFISGSYVEEFPQLRNRSVGIELSLPRTCIESD